jgi:hypothetical protein
MTIEGYRNAGDIEINHLTLVSRSGQSFDITELMLEVNIYQGIYDKTMKAEIVIGDATGLIDFLKMPKNQVGGFAGSEVLLMSYRTPSEEYDRNKHIFVLNSLSNRKRVEENMEVFVLEGVSLETFATIDKKISRSYGGTRGNTVDKMMSSITREFYQSEAIRTTYTSFSSSNFNVKKTITIDDTKGLHKFVIPNLSISDTIDFMAMEATGDNIGSFYTFYEDSNGFHFRNFAKLVDQNIKETYSYEPSNYREGGKKADDPYFDAFKIIDFEVIKDVDMLDNMSGGLYGSKTILVDVLRKNTIEQNYSYEKNADKFSKFHHIVPGASLSTAVVDMKTTRFGHDQLSIFDKEAPKPKSSERTAQFKRSYRKHISNKLLEVTVHGNSNLNVGDVVWLSFPVATTTEDGFREDKYMTGKHLITSLRHKFDKNQFVTVFECIKDTGYKR